MQRCAYGLMVVGLGLVWGCSDDPTAEPGGGLDADRDGGSTGGGSAFGSGSDGDGSSGANDGTDGGAPAAGDPDGGDECVAAEEVCNGVDDDCDGAVDEALDPIPADNVEGACADNVQVCAGADGYVDGDDNYVPQAEMCDGVDNDCANGVDDGLAPIAADNVQGACAGNVRICDGERGYVDSPDNHVPTTEVCNGLDDDCAGGVDDGLVERDAPVQQGACAGNRELCDGQNGWVLTRASHLPVAEVCDGIDNDCAGGVDDGLAPIAADNVQGACAGNVKVCDGAQGYVDDPGNYVPSDEVCDGIDNDCAGGVDDGLEPVAADNVQGACAGNVKVCDGAQGYVDDPGNHAPSDEVCNGVDDDCANGVDDGLVERDTANQQGACDGNRERCAGAEGWVLTASSHPPVAETCNGVDDDCANGVDDGMDPIPADNVEGACADNVKVCDGAQGYVADDGNYAPVEESCNGIDDDCAGGVDDGMDPIPADNVEGECADNVKVCDGDNGYVDADGNHVPTAELCNGLDDNCADGVDEDFDVDGDDRFDGDDAGCVATYEDADLDCNDAITELTDFCPIFVDASASGRDDGRDWDNAFVDLNDALAAAASGDEIWLAAGVYRPAAPGDRESAFDVPGQVQLLGGFDGSSYARESRLPSTQEVVLDGDLQQNDDVQDPDNTLWDNSCHVVKIGGVDDVVLDGLTISGARWDGACAGGDPADVNGALQVLDARGVRLSRVVLRDSSTANVGAALGVERAELEVRDSLVTRNGLPQGAFPVGRAPVYLGHSSESAWFDTAVSEHEVGGLNISSGTHTLTRVQLHDNTTIPALELGAVIDGPAPMVTLDDCEVFGHRDSTAVADFGGTRGGTLRILNSRFEDNDHSVGNGQAAALFTAGDLNLHVSNCEFVDNTCSGAGCAMFVDERGSDIVVRDSLFENNQHVAEFGGSAGAVYLTNGDGLEDLTSRTLLLRNRFVGNSSNSRGGALQVFFTHARISSCAFSGNSAVRAGDETTEGGGAVYMIGSEASFINCSFGGNVTDAIVGDGNPGSDLYAVPAANGEATATIANSVFGGTIGMQDSPRVSVVVRYSCLPVLDPGDTNITAPLPFGDLNGADGVLGTRDDNLGLAGDGLACVDSGSNSRADPDNDLDLVGNPRFVDHPTADAGEGTAPLIDRGAMELPSP